MDVQLKLTWKGLLAFGLVIAFVYASSRVNPDTFLERLIELAGHVMGHG